jgi:hypothetical protein
MNATHIEPSYLFQKIKQRFFSYTRFLVNKINVEKIFKIMRKLLFNYSFYSQPEIGKFQGVTNPQFATRSMGVAETSPSVPRKDDEGVFKQVEKLTPIASNGPRLGGSTRGYTS